MSGARRALWRLGVHASAAGGVSKAPRNAAKYVGETVDAMAIFTRNQRRWQVAAMDAKEPARFAEACAAVGLDRAYTCAHGSYLCNLGNPDDEKYEKSVALMLDEATRCDLLGIPSLVFHPGSTVGQCEARESCARIAEGVDRVLDATENVRLVLENTAGGGNTLGRTFEELQEIIKGVSNSRRVGVCLDTCHLFAGGYDIRTAEGFDGVLKEFDDIIGLDKLVAWHLNDSIGDLNSRRDRHAPIGKGLIGEDAFRFVMADERFTNMPLILETGTDSFADDVALLRSFQPSSS